MDTKELLLQFSALHGVSGREGEAAAFAKTLLEPFGRVETTALGSVICRVWECGSGHHIMLDAHIDEIGMIVTYIEDAGFLRVSSCGGIDRRLLLASPVLVHTGSGTLDGVVCSVPPHLAGEGEHKNSKVEEIYIDVGLEAQAAREHIRPGDRVTIRSAARALLGDQVSGKAIDDRAGCVALLAALEALKGTEPACDLSVAFTTLEEVGCMGAGTAAHRLAPTHAVVVDVSFAHTPDAPKEKCGKLGKGPMIGFAPILSAQMSDALVRTAQRSGIAYQLEVMGGRTGTNADSIAVSRGGVRTALVSIPQKYMHTPIETVAVRDVEQTGLLIAEYLKEFFAQGGAV